MKTKLNIHKISDSKIFKNCIPIGIKHGNDMYKYKVSTVCNAALLNNAINDKLISSYRYNTPLPESLESIMYDNAHECGIYTKIKECISYSTNSTLKTRSRRRRDRSTLRSSSLKIDYNHLCDAEPILEHEDLIRLLLSRFLLDIKRNSN